MDWTANVFFTAKREQHSSAYGIGLWTEKYIGLCVFCRMEEHGRIQGHFRQLIWSLS